MPPKRGRKKKKSDETSRSKKVKTSVVEKDDLLKQKIVDLYKSNASTTEALQQSEERGDLHKIVWPYLLEHHSEQQHEGDVWNKACWLLAILTSTACREGSFVGGALENIVKSEAFDSVINTLLQLEFSKLNHDQQATLVHFVTVCLSQDVFQETSLMTHLTGLNLWLSIPPRRLELELKQSSGGLRRLYATLEQEQPQVWIISVIQQMLNALEESLTDNKSSDDIWNFLHRSMELLIDLLSIRSTRRYLVTYLESIHFAIQCRFAVQKAQGNSERRLFLQLLERVEHLLEFPIQAQGTATFVPLSKPDMVSIYHGRATVLQKMCHRYYVQQVPDVIYAGVGLLCNNKEQGTPYLVRALNGLQDEQVLDLLHKLRLLDKDQAPDRLKNRDVFLAILLRHVSIPSYPLDRLESYPLYPTESVLWDFFLIPPGMRTTTSPVLSLPKLNTQFLSFDDYLLRNFELTRLESAYEIRSDLVHAITRVRPVVRQVMSEEDDGGNAIVQKTEFDGWARMALELASSVEFVKVSHPKLGHDVPSEVLADIEIDLVHCGPSIRQEWDSLSEFDVLFLVGIDASQATGGSASEEGEKRVSPEDDVDFPQRHGVMAVRGCMVKHVRDEEGTILSDPTMRYDKSAQEIPQAQGTKRILRVEMDPAQFAADARGKHGLRVYNTLNLVVRRHGRENNFKAVLETIRGLMQGTGSIQRVLPPWLQPLLLGIGDASEASYKSETIKSYATKTAGVTNPDAALDYGDTFLDEQHLRSSFGENCKVVVDGREEQDKSSDRSTKRCNYRVRIVDDNGDSGNQLVEATTYQFPMGVNGNPVRFTPVQVEAVRSGLSPGLTLVVGPPGTGKTDVAVQIIANLYHSFPTQRTLIVTHSNAALNDLFEKVMARGDVDERYLIRLGSGERELKTSSTHDFTRAGRVAQSLSRRGVLLEQVQLLSESLGISGKAERGADGSPSYTCETAEYFDGQHVQKRIQLFEDKVTDMESQDVSSEFPFKKYFGLEDGNSVSVGEAREKFSQLRKIFDELSEYRPLEMLRTLRLRTDYLLMKQAKVVAMTCTHAAIARSHLIELGFHYDNVVMEEAGQMMEVETFIPLLLQRGESTDDNAMALSRLKRVCLIGDHQQLPPVIKNMSFSKFSNLDQSLFSRLIRLGFPYIQLDRQGRARTDIAKLYSWRYKDLGNLAHVLESPSFQIANTGFAHTYQIVNVDKYQGRGETTPTAYFYQNMGEAEYMVALFQFMVLIGYPPKRISLLTTYNGQKDLLMDILEQRCGEGTPFAGMRPGAVSTVDRYQGQQNDFILLSLVRTEAVGHLRDVRRLVVAVSRARLGLFVFCRQDLFQSCHELKETMNQFAQRPNKLQLVLNEHYPTKRRLEDDVSKNDIFEVEDVTHLGSIVHSMQEDWIAVGNEQDTGAATQEEQED